MNKKIALRTQVKTVLSSVTTEEIYFGQALQNASKQYIVYTLNEVTRSDGKITYELEINVMDYGTNTANAEDLADNIQAAFDKRVAITDDIAVYFYAETNNTVNEEDRNIIRRRLTFATYLYERT